jgi:hypothetical protein
VKQDITADADPQTVLFQVVGFNMNIANDPNMQSYYRDKVRQNLFKNQAFHKGAEDELYIYARYSAAARCSACIK